MSDEDYTPDTDEVRNAYSQAKWETFGNEQTTASSDINVARDAFDRWLAGVIAQAKAEAYEHAATIADESREDGDGDPRQIRDRIRFAARAVTVRGVIA